MFLAGLPGSGKTHIIQKRLRAPYVLLDLDAEIKKHPEYDCERRADVYRVPGAYDWANDLVETKFQRGIRDGSIMMLCVDGTGTKVDRRIRRMRQARQHGMHVKLLYVRTTLETALARNESRKRVVVQATNRMPNPDKCLALGDTSQNNNNLSFSLAPSAQVVCMLV